MKAKVINKILREIINDLCEHIDSEAVKTILKNNSFITGGCIPSMIIDEFVNDFDIYLETAIQANIMRTYFSGKGFQVGTDKYRVKLITENSINLSDGVQIVTKFTGTPEMVTENFDWGHIKSYWRYPDTLVIPDYTYRLISEKELVYTGSAYPLSSMLRLKKYLKKGWDVSNTTMITIMMDVVKVFSEKSETEKTKFDMPFGLMVEVDRFVEQLNGVDPITIQARLEKHSGMRLPISEIISMINEGR
jgi:hypothetical protein